MLRRFVLRRLVVRCSVAAVGVTVLGALAACGSSTGGSPTPGSSSEGSPSATTESATPSSAQGGSLASIDPCSLLTQSQAVQLDMAWPGEAKHPPIGPECFWNQKSDSQFARVGVGFLLDKGVAQVIGHGGAITDLKVGSHNARRHSEAAGCFVSLGVTPTSRVDVIAADTNDNPDCDLAMRAAKLVEKNLPES